MLNVRKNNLTNFLFSSCVFPCYLMLLKKRERDGETLQATLVESSLTFLQL